MEDRGWREEAALSLLHLRQGKIRRPQDPVCQDLFFSFSIFNLFFFVLF